jgi:hypothetical protein
MTRGFAGLFAAALVVVAVIALRGEPPSPESTPTPAEPRCGAGRALGVVEEATPLAEFPWGENAALYGAAYERFIELAADHAKPMTRERMETMLDAMKRGERPDEINWRKARSNADLNLRVRAGLNLEFLLDGLDARRLTVRPGPGASKWAGRQVHLALQDPFVGTFEVLLLLPPGAGPWPAVVVHPGHFENAEFHRDNRFGADFPAAGIALAILTPRANDSFPVEDRVSRALVQNGFSFMGLRVYELLLVKKALRCRSEIRPKRIGLLGHSGGAVVGNLAIRVDTSWTAYVGDLWGDYLNWDSATRTAIDELAPHVHPVWEMVNDFETAELPVLTLPYEFGETGDAMVSFFTEHL